MLGFSPLASLPLGDEAFEESIGLTLTSITAGSPTLQDATLSPVYNFNTVAVTTPQIIVLESTLEVNYNFTLVSIVTQNPTINTSSLTSEASLTLVPITAGVPSLSRPIFFSQGPFNPDYNKQRVAFIVSENRSVIVPFTPRKVTQEVKLQNRTTRI